MIYDLASSQATQAKGAARRLRLLLSRPVVASFICAVLFCAMTFHFGIQPRRGYLQDDAHFYSQTAYNLATLGKSTFDGLNITDGYHILWCCLLAIVSKVVSLFTLDKGAHLFAHLILSAFLIFYTVFRFGRGVAERILLFGLAYMGSLGMETHLLALLYLLLCATLLDSSNHKMACLWAFLIPLARIDATIMPAAALAVLSIERTRWPHLARVLAALAVGVLTHYALQYSIDGHWFSVSSLAKTQSLTLRLFRNLWLEGRATVPRSWLLVMLAGASGWLVLRNRRFQGAIAVGAAWLGASAFSFGHLTVSYMAPWYFVPGHLSFAWILCETSRRSADPVSHRVRNGVLVMALAYLMVIYLPSQVHKYFAFEKESQTFTTFINEIRSHVPENEPIFQVDGSGFTGFWSGRRVVNGDGLINSHEYLDHLRRNQVRDYILNNHISYLMVTHVPQGDWLVDCGGFQVAPSDVTPLVEYRGEHAGRRYHFGLYRWQPVETVTNDTRD